MEYTRNKANECVAEAEKQLQLIPDSDAKAALIGLLKLAVQRKN